MKEAPLTSPTLSEVQSTNKAIYKTCNICKEGLSVSQNHVSIPCH